MDLYSPQVIKAIKQKFGFKNTKSLGQNFLTDPGVIENIISGAGIGKTDLVIEIGPGFGVLTDSAAAVAGKVVAIEVDKELLPVLDFTLSHKDNVEVLNQDILKTDLNEVIDTNINKGTEVGVKIEGVKIIGNLPYYITTPILMHLLENHIKADSITVMMQKEVGERIEAEPGSRIYGALSVAVQYRCLVETIVAVPKESFYPAPKVDSVVLKLTRREKPAVKPKSEELFFRMVKAGFSQRRKTILNSLATSGYGRDVLEDCLNQVGIDNKRRAETLSLEDFCSISDYLFDLNN